MDKEKELEYMVSEITKTKLGKESFKRSAKIMKKSGWATQAKKLLKSKSMIVGGAPQGVPFRQENKNRVG